MSRSSSASSSSSTVSMVGKVIGLAGLSSLGVLYYCYQRQLRGSPPPPAPGLGGGSAPSPSQSAAASTPIRDALLERVEKVRHRLESSCEEFDFESASEAATVSPPSSSAEGQPAPRRVLDRSTKALARVLRQIRRFSASERHRRDTSLPPLHALHRAEMARVLLLFHRSSQRMLSSSEMKTQEDVEREDKERAQDMERAWRLMEGREKEVEQMQKQMKAEGYAPKYPLHTTPAFSSLFPDASFRNETAALMLDIALEGQNGGRIWRALKWLLQMEEGADQAAASSSTSATPAAATPSSASPLLIAPSVLQSLDYGSLMTAYQAVAYLDQWLWTFQIGQRLFTSSPAPASAPSAASSSAAAASAPASFSAEGGLYDSMHSAALESPQGVDWAIVYDIAVQKVAHRIKAEPKLKDKLGIQGPLPRSTLPFEESGAIVQHDDQAKPSLSAAAPSVTPTSSASSPRVGASPSPTSSLSWSEWDIRAYSTQVESVVTSDPTLQQSIWTILSQQAESIHLFPQAGSFSPPASPDPSHSSLSSAVPSALASAHVRRIRRRGRLIHSVGLFAQPIPVVGAVGERALQSAAHGQHAPLSFSMQGYVHVETNGSGGAQPQNFVQFEYYSFTQPEPSPPSDSSSDGHLSGSGSSSGSGGITNSMVSAHAADTASATDGEGLAYPSDMHLSAASLSHSHSPLSPLAHDDLSPIASPSQSTHLFDSASFAFLDVADLQADRQSGVPSPLLSPGSNASAPFSGASSGLQSSPSPLHRLASELAPRAEVWSGSYRVIQLPDSADAREGTQPPPPASHVHLPRPRVEVTYRIGIVVVNCDKEASATNVD